MIKKIRTHNVLYGIKFSIAEFLFIALVIAPFTFYYLIHNWLVYGFISFGIVVNCLTVAVLGLRQLSSGETDRGLQQLLDKQRRDDIRRANPHLLKDTLVITITALLPYVLLALVIFELLTSEREHNS